MDNVFEYKPSAVKPYNCQQSCDIALINAESRKEKYVFWNPGGIASYTPHKFTGTVIRYMGEELVRRGVKLTNQSQKKIMVSLGEAKFDLDGWTQRGFFELKIKIPDLNFQKTYRGSDASPEVRWAIAYAVHHSVMEFMEDPVVVKYIESKP